MRSDANPVTVILIVLCGKKVRVVQCHFGSLKIEGPIEGLSCPVGHGGTPLVEVAETLEAAISCRQRPAVIQPLVLRACSGSMAVIVPKSSKKAVVLPCHFYDDVADLYRPEVLSREAALAYNKHQPSLFGAQDAEERVKSHSQTQSLDL